MDIDYSKLTDVRFSEIDHDDYPDYCDAYIESATYDGVDMTDEELEELEINIDPYIKYSLLMDYINNNQ